VTVITGGFGPVNFEEAPYNYFTNTLQALEWEAEQVKHIAKIISKVSQNDIVFFFDLNFPGLSLPLIHILRLVVKGIKIFGYLHGGSYCKDDIYAPVKHSKSLYEKSLFAVCDGIFVATNYHKQLIKRKIRVQDNNIFVVRAPFYKEYVLKYAKPKELEIRKYDVLIVNRPQQIDLNIIKGIINMEPKLKFVFTRNLGIKNQNVEIKPVSSRSEYYELMADSKVLLLARTEETFGYPVLEAISLGTIPICPNKFSYPEILSDINLLYSNVRDLREKLNYVITTNYKLRFDFTEYENCIKKISNIMRSVTA
jgi:hypothetical protein